METRTCIDIHFSHFVYLLVMCLFIYEIFKECDILSAMASLPYDPLNTFYDTYM